MFTFTAARLPAGSQSRRCYLHLKKRARSDSKTSQESQHNTSARDNCPPPHPHPPKRKKKRYLARAKSFIRNRSGDQVELRRPFTAQGDAGVDLTSLSCHAKMLTVSVTVHLARVHGVYTCPEPISVSSPAVFPLFFYFDFETGGFSKRNYAQKTSFRRHQSTRLRQLPVDPPVNITPMVKGRGVCGPRTPLNLKKKTRRPRHATHRPDKAPT